MGARLLRNWLSQPLAAVEPIRQRRKPLTYSSRTRSLDTFRAQLTNVRDLERTLGRLSTGSGNACDLVVLRRALEQIPALKQTLSSLVGDEVTSLRQFSQSLLTSSPTSESLNNPSPGLSATLSPSDGERDGVRAFHFRDLTAQLSRIARPRQS